MSRPHTRAILACIALSSTLACSETRNSVGDYEARLSDLDNQADAVQTNVGDCIADAQACFEAAATPEDFEACAEQVAACVDVNPTGGGDTDTDTDGGTDGGTDSDGGTDGGTDTGDPPPPDPGVPGIDACTDELQTCIETSANPLDCLDTISDCVGAAVDTYVSGVCDEVLQQCLDSGAPPDACNSLTSFGPCA